MALDFETFSYRPIGLISQRVLVDNANSDFGYKQVVDTAAILLKTHGFKKRGNAFRKTVAGNVSIVEFQRSRDNTPAAIKFTINVGVISAELLRRWDRERDIAKETVWSAHLRCRVGDFLPVPEDHWWILKSGADHLRTEAEVNDLLLGGVLPFLEEYTTDAALLRLWKSGRSPGLTDGQCKRNIAELSDALASGA